MSFTYHKLVQFYETDSMGVVHHSNYLRYFEEARAAWMKEKNLFRYHYPETSVSFAVLSSSCEHKAACRFGDQIEIKMQMRSERSKVYFQYAVYIEKEEKLVATGHTLHIALDDQFFSQNGRHSVEVTKLERGFL